MISEIGLKAGDEAALITVELDVLVSGLNMHLELVRLGSPVGTVRTGEALPMFGHDVPLEPQGSAALVTALIA